MDLNMKSSAKLMKFMILTILITSKSQIHNFHFMSLPDKLTQSVCHIKKSLKRRAIVNFIFSINSISSIHINMLNNNNITSSFTQQNSDQLLQQARNLLKLVFQQIKVANQLQIAININAINEV